ncbi:hypothetical protein GCM10017559_08020 [Streptosporangium longisporum]|uniref:Transcriptional regulator WhiB n=1 Tax=Streptosporangium longisporum TaxID=46187 RepID=A0ABN3XRP9_9ACTN
MGRRQIICACCGHPGPYGANNWVKTCTNRWRLAGRPNTGPPPRREPRAEPSTSPAQRRAEYAALADLGRSTTSIAWELSVSTRTVERYAARRPLTVQTQKERRMSWDKDAACRRESKELMFPLSYAAENPQVREAKAVCRSCPITSACLAYALERGEPEGIWGGQTPQERRRSRTDTFTPVPAPVRKPQQQWTSGGCPICLRLAIRIRSDNTLAAHSREPGRLAHDMTCPGGAAPSRRKARQEATR